MAIQNASDVVLSVQTASGLEPIAHATSASISMNMDLRDSTSKSSGGWQENLGGLKSYELTGDAFVEVDPSSDGSQAYLEELYTAWETGEAINAKFGMSVSNSEALTFSGSALITSISVDAGVEENATFSISLTGTGQLTKG